MVVGGTGLYVKALTAGLFAEPPLDRPRRDEMTAVTAAMDHSTLVRWASRLDPGFDGGGGRHRAARAIEVAMLTGQPLSWWQRSAAAQGSVTTVDRAAHRAAPGAAPADSGAHRGDGAARAGRGSGRGAGRGRAADGPGMDGVGVREAVAVLHGTMPRESLAGAIATSTRQYAKRQETWFRHQLGADVLTLDATRPPEQIAAAIVAAWERVVSMKIGITCYPTYGGSGAVATELGLDLARRGHEVHFITYQSPFRLRGYTKGVSFHEVDTSMSRYPLFEHYPYELALASRQYEVAMQEKLDLLHVHYAIPHATTAYPRARDAARRPTRSR